MDTVYNVLAWPNIVVIRSRVEKARARALLMLQGQDASISVSTAGRSGYQYGTSVDPALYPPLVDKIYDVDTRGRHGRRAARCACSAHAHWTPYVDEDAAVGLVEGVDVVPEMEFARSNVHDALTVRNRLKLCYG